MNQSILCEPGKILSEDYRKQEEVDETRENEGAMVAMYTFTCSLDHLASS